MMNEAITSVLFAAEGGAPTYESHHWLLPETFEIIYGGISSVLVIGALIKFAGPIVKKSLAARTERIQNEIDNARNARSSAEAEAQQIRSALGDISSERSRILAEADAAATVVLSEGRARVSTEMADFEAKALADIANASGRVQDELASDIKRLARIASDKVIASAMNDSVRQDLIENFISGVAR
jgi:F-type H+-transporting ATPase subunit b